jgi:hypothetical protein
VTAFCCDARCESNGGLIVFASSVTNAHRGEVIELAARHRLLELQLCLPSFWSVTDFVFEPPLRLARDVTVRTLDDAAEFARTYVGPRLPHRRDRMVRRLEEVSDNASARIAARAFRAWAIAEGLLVEES